MKVLKNIFIIIISFWVSAMLVFMTIAFSKGGNFSDNKWQNANILKFYLPSFVDGKLEKTEISENPEKWKVIYSDFGRLTSVFFLSGDNSLSEGLSFSGKTVTFDSVKGIFSGYDPFAIYEVENKSRTFNLTQITNWSFYFGENSDKTVSIYSIDSVSKLTFYFTNTQGERKEATNMILFPGMMIRFDPNRTEILENKDLLWIKIILTTPGIVGEDKNTWLYFGIARDKDETTKEETFFFSYLPRDARILFENLHNLLAYRAKSVENLKSYSKSDIFGIASKQNNTVANPSKNAYRLLGNLQIIFSKWVNGEISASEFKESVLSIIAETEKYESNNSAKKLVEQFLIDGRFALFTNEWENLAQYQALYTEAASILGIVPETGKWRLFQSLANIFSKNLITTNVQTFSESYGNIASSLKDTLNQNGIDDKDYFDIALYAFYILERVRDGRENIGFSRIAVESSALYQLYSTIVDASQKYANSRPASLQLNTQSSLIVEFYNDMLLKLNTTLYSEYIENEEWYLYVKKWFLNRGLPDFTAIKSTILDISNFYKKISNIYNDKVRTSKTNEIFEERIVQLEWFLNIINRDNYHIYRENPYKSINSQDKYPPVYDKKSKKLITKNSDSQNNNSNSVVINSQTGNSNELSKADIQNIINSVNSVFSVKISDSNIKLSKENNENIYNVNFVYLNKNILLKINNNLSQNSIISYSGNTIKIEDKMSLSTLKIVISSFANYEKKIQKIINENRITKIENISINIAKKYIIINKQKFSL